MIENEKVEELMLELEDKTEKTISVLEGEYTAIRAGRANPHVLDRVEVEAYGGMKQAHRAWKYQCAGREVPANQRVG